MKRLSVALGAFLMVAQLAWAAPKQLEGTVNLNAASSEQLMLLPGVGPVKAQAILSYRQTHPFKAIAELGEVKGIGPKMVKGLEKYLTVEGLTTLHEVKAVSVSKPTQP